jgi:alpha-tubulin suppressor-like RCC1 family protein
MSADVAKIDKKSALHGFKECEMKNLAGACVVVGVCFFSVPDAIAYGGAHSGTIHIFSGPRSPHVCALMADAKLACSVKGTDKLMPFDVSQKEVIKVALGKDFGCALTSDTKVFCWGDNSFGKLGTSAAHAEPQAVQLGASDFDAVTDIATGSDHTCAIRSDGTAWCWGINNYGQLGNYLVGVGNWTSTPTQVILHDGSDTPLTNLKAISAGSVHTCALFTNNSGACWGYDNDGELSNGSMSTSSTPYVFDSPHTIFVQGNSGLEALIMGGASISLGGDHACSLVTDMVKNSVGCWGYNATGQLGVGDKGNRSLAYPARDERGKIIDATSVSAGRYFTCATVQDRTVRCWGYNDLGQMGTPSTDYGDSQVTGAPVQLGSGVRLNAVVEIATAEQGVYALRSNGDIVTWGYDPSDNTHSRYPFSRPIDAPLFTDNFDNN